MIRLFFGTTFFSSLLIRKAPGTVSSFVVFLLLYFFDSISLELKFVVFFGTLICHFICFPFFRIKYKSDDPSLYTLDEALAMVLLNIFFNSKGSWIAAFLLFRFFDIIKPLGIKKIEMTKKLPDAVKNIADDLVAAFYTFLILEVHENFYK